MVICTMSHTMSPCNFLWNLFAALRQENYGQQQISSKVLDFPASCAMGNLNAICQRSCNHAIFDERNAVGKCLCILIINIHRSLNIQTGQTHCSGRIALFQSFSSGMDAVKWNIPCFKRFPQCSAETGQRGGNKQRRGVTAPFFPRTFRESMTISPMTPTSVRMVAIPAAVHKRLQMYCPCDA